MNIERFLVRVEKHESKTKAKNRKPVPVFYRRDGENEEEFKRRVQEVTKDWTLESGRARFVKFMNLTEHTPRASHLVLLMVHCVKGIIHYHEKKAEFMVSGIRIDKNLR